MGEWVGWLERSIARDQSFKPILPFFWIPFSANVGLEAFHRWEAKTFLWLFRTGLGTFLFRIRHPGVRLHRLGNSLQSPLKSFPPLSEASDTSSASLSL
ncbi:hypothetical protein NPIL_99721 [Nephila pilipes]|uniref:Uncharacterized protein n=1 Tax=Nephila pilipes TaxID=299642 RepID=A0A8X6Q359_NEPPI|nr:hypothetical protein NPIL_99721 [Nephila pilipes]